MNPKDAFAAAAEVLTPYAGKVDVDKYTQSVAEVSARLNARGLAFQFGNVAAVITAQQSAVFRDPADPKRAAVTTQVVTAVPEGLRLAVERVSDWTRYDANRKKRVTKPVPFWLLQQIVVGRGKGLAPLAGVADHPVYHDGELLAGRIGYHRPTRLFIDCAPCEADPWRSPEEALHFLSEVWLKPFPFRTDGDRLRALFLPLALLTRRTLIRGGAPLVFITAPEMMSGKTLLATCAHLAVTGREPPTLPYPRKDEELAKVLLSALSEGGSMLLFDNCPNRWKIASANIDRYSTNDTYSDRPLGVTEVRTLPALAIMAFTGNNIVPGSDTRTRAYDVRLERVTGSDDALRDAMEFTRNNRSRILGALAAVLRADPRPGCETRFTDWELIVARKVMALAGAKDLLADMVAAASLPSAGDEDLGRLLLRMAEMSSGSLLKNEPAAFSAAELLADPECRAALEALLGGGGRAATVSLEAKNIGRQLTCYRDMAAGGHRLRFTEVRNERHRRTVTGFLAEALQP